MADQDAKSYLIWMKLGTRAFLKLLITHLNIINISLELLLNSAYSVHGTVQLFYNFLFSEYEIMIKMVHFKWFVS